MSSVLENLKWSVERLTTNATIKLAVDSLFKALEEENKAKMNYEAFIRVDDIDTKEIELPDSDDYGDTWEVVTGTFRYDDEHGAEVSIDVHRDKFEERRDEIMANYSDQITDLENDISDMENEAEDLELLVEVLEDEMEDLDEENDSVALSEKRALVRSHDSEIAVLADKIDKAKEQLKALEYAKYNVENADFEEDEIYWNTLYQYEGKVDEHAAIRCGLAIVRVDDGEYLGLTGCGMDLSPKFFCYQALAHNRVDAKWSSKIRNLGPDYFRNVVGDDVFKAATSRLGISEYMDAAQDELKARVAAFDAEIKDISKGLKDGSIDKELGGILGLTALVTSL